MGDPDGQKKRFILKIAPDSSRFLSFFHWLNYFSGYTSQIFSSMIGYKYWRSYVTSFLVNDWLQVLEKLRHVFSCQ